MKTSFWTLLPVITSSVSAGLAASPGPCGATLPWTVHEAEAAHTNATAEDPSRAYLTAAAEACGRRFVRLAETGDYVEFTATTTADTIVVRYCIPDAPTGGGIDATLGLSINGKPAAPLSLTSRYAWSYGDFPWTNDPAAGRAHHFFDDVNARIPQVAPGDVIRLEKRRADAAAYYLIDRIELEQAPAPMARPENSLCLTDFGAVADDLGDDRAAFTHALEQARNRKLILWIPPGTFRLDGPRIPLGGVRVQGAGMWHSRLAGAPLFEGTGEPVRIADIAIFGSIAHRDDTSPDNAFNGNFGEGSRFERIWIEHVKCGFWTLNGTIAMVLRDSRIRNTMADGLNFCDGTSDSTVGNCHIRNTGDDALATWSPTGDWSSKQPCIRNAFLNNTVEQPWHANGIALYGGGDHRIAGNLVRETVYSGAGILVSSGFGAVPFSGTVEVDDNQLDGTGGDCYIGQPVGALWIHSADSAITVPLRVRRLAVTRPAAAAVTIIGTHAVAGLDLRGLDQDAPANAR